MGSPHDPPNGRRALLQASLLYAARRSIAAPAGMALLSSTADAAQAGPALAAVCSTPQWFNTPPLRPEDLRGKVVVVGFWTYSCINSLRVLPYLRAWAARYRAQGLVVIGVHTPEFAFEADAMNVKRAVAELGVDFPVALDSDRRIWRAYDNDAWPAFYFIGADGQLRDRAIGEGHYEQSERLIQKLLMEARAADVPSDAAEVSGTGAQAAPDLRNLRSNETYIGWGQASGFVSPGGLRPDLLQVYRAPDRLALNCWSLAGSWTVGQEFATLQAGNGRIAHRFHARDLHLVMGPSADGRPVRYRVRLDGQAPEADHGTDTDAAGNGTVREPRMYQLVRQHRAVADRTFEIEFLDLGMRAYVFTFG